MDLTEAHNPGYLSALVTLPFVAAITFSPAHPWWRPHDVAWMISGAMTAMTCMLSIREVIKHLENYSSGRMQKHIIRILFMPPIYAIDCWVGMRCVPHCAPHCVLAWRSNAPTISQRFLARSFESVGIYLTVIREAYEAVGIPPHASRLHMHLRAS
jgi:hypothetical protein